MVQYFSRGRSDWYSTGYLGLSFYELLDESAETPLGFGFGAGVGRQWLNWVGTEFLVGWETTGVSTVLGYFDTSIISLKLQVVAMAF